MRSIKIIMSILLCLLFCLTSTARNIKKGKLKKGDVRFEKLNANEKHRYSINLKSEQYCFLRIKQKGIDITITTYDPDNKEINAFNTHNGNEAPELVTLISDKKGTYFIEVSPNSEKESNGAYELVVEKVQPKAVTAEEQIDELFAQWDNVKTPGLALAVIKDGATILNKAYGSANLEYNIPIQTNTVFNIASVSKQFTSFAILQLANSGKLSLQDDIRKYLPELPEYNTSITIEQLANHTSGLRGFYSLLTLTGWKDEDILTKDDILKILSSQEHLNYKPGENFLYVNSGYFLLAIIVERITGVSFAEYAKHNIFEPLKMSSTLIYDDYHLIIENKANSYSPDGNGFNNELSGDATIGSTNVYTTTEDLCKWVTNYTTHIVGNDEIFKQMNSPIKLNNGKSVSWYTFGQDARTYKGLKLYSHGGITAGYRAFLGRFPEQNLAVVLLSNDASFDWDGMGLKVADIYLKDDIIEKTKTDNISKNKTKVESIEIDKNLLKKYCGKYQLAPDMLIDITMKDNKLYGEAPGYSIVQLIPASNSEFTIQGTGNKVKFVMKNGETTKLVLTMDGSDSHANKLKPDSYQINFSAYTGDYYSKELGTIYTIKYENDHLITYHLKADNVVLTSTEIDYFKGDKWFLKKLEFIRNNENEITGFLVSASRCKKVEFNRLK